MLSSLRSAFQHAEMHKQIFVPHQMMALEDSNLDIPGLADQFKRKAEIEAEAAAAAAAAAASAAPEGVIS